MQSQNWLHFVVLVESRFAGLAVGQNRVTPKLNPGKWNHGLKPVVPGSRSRVRPAPLLSPAEKCRSRSARDLFQLHADLLVSRHNNSLAQCPELSPVPGARFFAGKAWKRCRCSNAFLANSILSDCLKAERNV